MSLECYDLEVKSLCNIGLYCPNSHAGQGWHQVGEELLWDGIIVYARNCS